MIREDRPKELPIVRLLAGIRNMGYTFESAILDIVDNSVTAKAKNIHILIQGENKVDSKIEKVIICDDGKGMNCDEVFNALELGSPESVYHDNSLSKYGFGLKSAGLSQANDIYVVSKHDDENDWNKASISWKDIKENNRYIVDENLELSEEDKSYIKKFNFDTYNSLTPNWYYKVLR